MWVSLIIDSICNIICWLPILLLLYWTNWPVANTLNWAGWCKTNICVNLFQKTKWSRLKSNTKAWENPVAQCKAGEACRRFLMFPLLLFKCICQPCLIRFNLINHKLNRATKLFISTFNSKFCLKYSFNAKIS